ncbi:MAG: hypothetical protein JNM47_06835 [Hyphomonadaceae bacterium]|jgi:formate hydrogenlyase subunit 3/multisubunit Na+/H+ antiporter MnhD subunit|nr:hypothetical protein [Hyphomonadaceae bacterium]
MDLAHLIWNGLVISALFWFGWTGLFQAEQSRDEMRRIAKFNGLPPPFEVSLIWRRIAGAIMLLMSVAGVAVLVFSIASQTAP